MKYRKKPVVIEAHRYGGSIAQMNALMFWINGGVYLPVEPTNASEDIIFAIQTLEGAMQASPGDYIIKGIEGEFYPCKPSVFEASYEPVEEE